MKSYTLENLRRIKSTDFETYNEYDLFQKTVYNGNVISTQNYIVKENEEMRMDKISFNIYGTTEYVEELMVINGIMNPWSVKAGDTIQLFYIADIGLIQGTEPEKGADDTRLTNPEKNTKQDPVRQNLSPTDNPGIKQVTLDTKAKKIKIMDRLS